MTNPDTNYWIIGPGENAQLWNDFLQQEMIAIGWNEMKIGDIVYAKNGRKRIIGKGIIRGDYQFNPQLEPYHHTRSVEWIKTGEWPTDTQIAQKTLTKFTPYPEWIEETEALINERNQSDLLTT